MKKKIYNFLGALITVLFYTPAYFIGWQCRNIYEGYRDGRDNRREM